MPAARRVEEEVVEEAGPDRHHVGQRCMPALGVAGVESATVAVDQLGEEVDADRADQGIGERVVDQRVGFARLASARAAATIVAVAPTLEARSQVSSSVRAIGASSLLQLLVS